MELSRLDALKTLKMVLIHDLVEIHAGDTFAYDEAANLGREERERAAAEELFLLLPSRIKSYPNYSVYVAEING